jgi:uncharacterized membrane protein YbhN (UPF0104 family)
VLAAVATDTTSLVLMAVRWRLLLRRAQSRAYLWDVLLAYSAGVCVSNVTPARTVGGDACRIALIPRPGGSPSVSAIVATVFCDRLADAAGILLLGVLALPVLMPASAYWLLVLVILAGGGLLARPLLQRIAARVVRRHPTLAGRELGRAVPGVLLCSLAIWLLDITRLTLVGAAFGVHFTPSRAASVSLLRLGSGAVPIPAGIGVVDGALIAGFTWLGLPRSTAVGMAIVERAIVYGWQTGLGAVSLLLAGGSRAWRKARASTAAVSATAAPVAD